VQGYYLTVAAVFAAVPVLAFLWLLTGFFVSFATAGAGLEGAVAGVDSAAKAATANTVTRAVITDFILISFLVASTFCWRTYTTRQQMV
jgi:hypothetical protein